MFRSNSSRPGAFERPGLCISPECSRVLPVKLYFAPRTRATRARWLLEELEISYELVKLDLSKQENRRPEYLAVSPLGEVPALVDGDLTLLEPSAIALHLADRFPERQLAPPPGSAARGGYYQWLLFTESTLAPVVMKIHEQAQRAQEVPVADRAMAQRDPRRRRHRGRAQRLSRRRAPHRRRSLDGGPTRAK